MSSRPESDIEAEEPLSVTTGRDLEEIAEQADRVWGPKGEVSKNGRAKKKTVAVPKWMKKTDDGAAKASLNGRSAKPKAKPLSAKGRNEIEKSLAKIGTKRSSMGTPAVQLARLFAEQQAQTAITGFMRLNSTAIGCCVESPMVRLASSVAMARTGRRSFPLLPQLLSSFRSPMDFWMEKSLYWNRMANRQIASTAKRFSSGAACPLWFYVFDLLFLDDRDIEMHRSKIERPCFSGLFRMIPVLPLDTAITSSATGRSSSRRRRG